MAERLMSMRMSPDKEDSAAAADNVVRRASFRPQLPQVDEKAHRVVFVHSADLCGYFDVATAKATLGKLITGVFAREDSGELMFMIELMPVGSSYCEAADCLGYFLREDYANKDIEDDVETMLNAVSDDARVPEWLLFAEERVHAETAGPGEPEYEPIALVNSREELAKLPEFNIAPAGGPVDGIGLHTVVLKRNTLVPCATGYVGADVPDDFCV